MPGTQKEVRGFSWTLLSTQRYNAMAEAIEGLPTMHVPYKGGVASPTRHRGIAVCLSEGEGAVVQTRPAELG